MPDLRSTNAGSVSTVRLCIGVALIAVVVLAGVLIPAHPLRIDRRWSEWMREIESGFLHHVALVFNYLGRGLGRGLTLAAIGLALVVTRRWVALLAFAVIEALTPLAVSILKVLVDRPRPPHELIHAGGSSFPSGHAAYAGATAVALVLLFTRAGGRRAIWWSVAALAIAAMAWSRTYLQVHWLSDAVAGAALGVGIALAALAAAQILTGAMEVRRPARRGTR